MTDKINPAEYKALLLARREELSALRERSVEARAVVTLDQQSVGRLSRMDALQGQAMAQEQDRRRELELARVEAALRRIETGEYGFCVSCDEAIAGKRLRLDPAVPVCVDCAGGGT